MESLFQQKFILFDVQTTGTNPDTSDILEVGWGLYEAAVDPHQIDWTIHLVELREALPSRIQKLTGLDAAHWQTESALSYPNLIAELKAFLHEHDALPILVHYARFKRPFLLKAMADAGYDSKDSRWPSLSERIVCSYELARRALPQLKSYSLRAVAGFAGYSLGPQKRSRDHLLATAFIWKYLVETGDSGSTPSPTLRLHEPGIRQKRLQLPDLPGVYYFIDQSDRVLYVGKASSLKHRLNSYFRGQKTKGSRLNEMLTRAVDFRFQILQNELEALLVESDEIKRLDPPYNRLLKTDVRRIHSFRVNDWLQDPTEWGYRLAGPLTSTWNMQWLLSLTSLPMKAEAVPENRWITSIFTAELLAAGKELIFGHQDFDRNAWWDLAQNIWAEAKKTEAEPDEETIEDEETSAEKPKEATPEQAAGFIKHTLLHVIRQLHRSRWLIRLAECELAWQFHNNEGPWYRITVQAGVPTIKVLAGEPEAPTQTGRRERLALFDIAMHDRLVILYNELRKGVRRGDHIRLCLRPGLILDQTDLARWL